MRKKQGNILQMMRKLNKEQVGEGSTYPDMAYHKVMHYQAREAAIPLQGVFELTPLCNLDCKMCYVHLQPSQMKERSLKSGKEWIKLMNQAIAQGMMQVELTGGEAMMHPDFEEIYLHLWQQGMQIAVMTNGILLNESRIEFFRQHRPASIQITMYGGTEATYVNVTGHAMYETVKHNILMAKQIGCKLLITMTPNRFLGKEDVLLVKEFVNENKLLMVVNNDLNEPRGDTGRTLGQFDLDIEEYVDIYQALYTNSGPRVKRDLLPNPGVSEEPHYGLLCSAGKSMFCVTWEWNMKACFDLPEEISLETISFDKAWHSLHQIALQYAVPSECFGCAYEKICNRCPAIHMQEAEPGHVNRKVCLRTIEFAVNGLVQPKLDKEKEKDENEDKIRIPIEESAG